MREGAWLTATIALFLLSLLLRQSLLFTVSLALLLTAGLARLWNRYCFTGLEFRRQISPRRAFPGELVELTTEVVNRKLLPLAWLEVDDDIPRELELEGGNPLPSHRPNRYQISNLLALRWYERVRRRYRLRCTTRGCYTLGPVLMRSGDIFGLGMNQVEVDAIDSMLVYPQVVPLTTLGLPAVNPFGEMRARQQLFEDPLRMVGVRPYAPGDSPRRMHWKATARTGQLQVRQFEATTSLRLAVFLNMNTFGPYWWWQGHDPEVLELAITSAASVASWGMEQGFQVGVYANGSIRYSHSAEDRPTEVADRVRVPPGRDPEQLVAVLEALARVLPFATVSIEQMLRAEARNLPWGTTVVLITAILTEEMVEILRAIKSAGHQIAVLLIGEGRVVTSTVPIRSQAEPGREGAPAIESLASEAPGGLAPGFGPGKALSVGRMAAATALPSVDQLLQGIRTHRVRVTWREVRGLQIE